MLVAVLLVVGLTVFGVNWYASTPISPKPPSIERVAASSTPHRNSSTAPNHNRTENSSSFASSTHLPSKQAKSTPKVSQSAVAAQSSKAVVTELQVDGSSRMQAITVLFGNSPDIQGNGALFIDRGAVFAKHLSRSQTESLCFGWNVNHRNFSGPGQVRMFDRESAWAISLPNGEYSVLFKFGVRPRSSCSLRVKDMEHLISTDGQGLACAAF